MALCTFPPTYSSPVGPAVSPWLFVARLGWPWRINNQVEQMIGGNVSYVN